MALTQPGPAARVHRTVRAWVPSPLIHLSPSDCLCIYFESVQFVRCVCERSGSFKHCSKSIALIKRHHFTDKRERNKTQAVSFFFWGVVWSLKKRDIQSKFLSHCKQRYHREAFRTTTKKRENIPAKIKGRKESYVFTISPAFLGHVYMMVSTENGNPLAAFVYMTMMFKEPKKGKFWGSIKW